jgi:hypothetical protein
MRYFVFVLLFVTSLPSQEVKHAHTVEHCRTQMSRIVKEEATGPDEALPHIDILNDWYAEMVHCEDVDPENKSAYDKARLAIIGDQASRATHFIFRHDLWGKFIEEDKAGKR